MPEERFLEVELWSTEVRIRIEAIAETMSCFQLSASTELSTYVGRRSIRLIGMTLLLYIYAFKLINKRPTPPVASAVYICMRSMPNLAMINLALLRPTLVTPTRPKTRPANRRRPPRASD
jgi:hypothetical protein